MSPAPHAAMSVSHGIATSAQTPVRLRRRAGTGSSTATANAGTLQSAIPLKSMAMSAPKYTDTPTSHQMTTGERIADRYDIVHAAIHASTTIVINPRPPGCVNRSPPDVRLSVASAGDDQRSAPFHVGSKRH